MSNAEIGLSPRGRRAFVSMNKTATIATIDNPHVLPAVRDAAITVTDRLAERLTPHDRDKIVTTIFNGRELTPVEFVLYHVVTNQAKRRKRTK